MKLSTKSTVLTLIAVAALLAAPNAQAVLLTGHATVGFGTSASGSINFVVIAPTDAEYAAVFTTLTLNFIPGVDNSTAALSGAPVAGDYIYMYQAMNDGAGSPQITSHSNSIGNGTPSSWGLLPLFLMTDTAVVDSVSPALSDCSTLTSACHNDGAGAGGGNLLDSGGVFSLTAGATIAPAANLLLLNPDSIAMTFGILGGGDGPLLPGEIGHIMFYTSPIPPAIGSGSLQDGGQSEFGATPQPAPEPGLVFLLGSGLAALGLVRRRRRN
jgi:hypothetical protein